VELKQTVTSMKSHTSPHPLITLPQSTQHTLYLIREELKSRKLFHALHEAGLDDCYFQPHLDLLIMQALGLDDDNDETFTRYDDILEKRSRKIEAFNDSVMKQAMKVYGELVELGKVKS
jgi:hypothetical protein